MKNTEFKKGDNVLSNSKWNNGKAGIVHAVYPYGVSVNFGDNINPSYQVFHFKPSHHMQTNINDLEIIPPLQIETDNELLATNDPELIKQGVPELTPAESTNEVKTVGREIYHPMWKRPNQSKDDITFSETVIVYGVKFHKEDLDISEIDDSVMGYFNFEKQEWFVLCDESLKLICWTYVPNPQQFMKDKFRDWKVELHNGYRP